VPLDASRGVATSKLYKILILRSITNTNYRKASLIPILHMFSICIYWVGGGFGEGSIGGYRSTFKLGGGEVGVRKCHFFNRGGVTETKLV
jgi:hypothetical protein